MQCLPDNMTIENIFNNVLHYSLEWGLSEGEGGAAGTAVAIEDFFYHELPL